MSAGEERNDLNEIDLEALRWVSLMEGGPLSAAQQRQLDAWASADLKHRGALIRAQAASMRLDRLGALAGGRSLLESLPPRGTTRRKIIAVAASATGMLAISAWLGRGLIRQTWGGTRYVSNVGEQRKVVLTDGSVMTLNTQTELQVRFSSEHREIDLFRGEAMFSVERDVSRPFAVLIDGWTALAVGTAFAVRRMDGAVTAITVTEGVVEMLSAKGIRQRVTANQEAIVVADGALEVRRLSDPELGRRLAWQRQLVVFAGEPLRAALAEMNRYSRRHIVVDDPQLAERQIVGVFSTTDIQTFVSGIEATLGVEAIERGDSVLLRRVN
jgi:transmembrane sensor